MSKLDFAYTKMQEFGKKTFSFLDRHKKVFLTIFIGLVLIRLWLFLTMNWYVNADTYYDSRLELNSAISMSSFKWAGAYSKVTLCKGLAFPIFLATLFLMRIPYPVGLFILVLIAAFLFARSLKPVIKNDWTRKVIFLFILYSPVGLGGEMTYPYRNALLPWAVLIVISVIVAIYLRRNAKIKKLLPWGLIGLVFSGFFWNLREDSIWFLPFILGGAMVAILHFWLERRKQKKVGLKRYLAFIVVTLLPLAGILIWNMGISIVNSNVYGVYTTEDRTKTYSAKTLGALIRIDDGADMESDYWVSSEALELAKKASPTFASLNIQAFDNWSKIGDFSIWALRDSVADSGYYKDAKETNDLYKKIYEELEEGFKNGTLKRKNGIQLSDTSGLYSMNEMFRPIGTTFKSFVNHAFYDEYEAKLEELVNVKVDGDIELYENELGITLLRSEEELDAISADSNTRKNNDNLRRLLRVNKKASNIIIKIYNVISPVLLTLAIVGVLLKVVLMIKNKNCRNYSLEIIIMLLGLVLLVLFYSYMVGLWGLGYDLTADSSLFKSYTTPQTIIVSLVEMLGVFCLITSVKEIFSNRLNTKKTRRKK
ncbi:MAG: hypothetical protein Q4A36_01305 [Candidatus Saccharibacteria bacterium]|nr:hypothetical protein [Candidatus Saccharibacteria bacterium]